MTIGNARLTLAQSNDARLSIRASPPKIGNKPGSDENGPESNPPGSLTTATKPAFEWGSRRRDVRLAKTHHRIGGATLTLGHLHVRDYRKDDRRKRHNRNKSKPIHRGAAAANRPENPAITNEAHKQQLGRNKDLAAPVLRLATREVRLGVH